MGKRRPKKWGATWECSAPPLDHIHVCPRNSAETRSETPAATPCRKLAAAQPPAQLPWEASSSVVTSQEQQPMMGPPPDTPWQSPEESPSQPETLENAHPSRKELFFQGQPTTLGALQILIGLFHVSCGGILAATPNFVEFPTTYWYPLAGGVLFFIAGAATLRVAANCTIPGMKVSTGLNLVSSLCAGLGMCAFVVELAASSRDTQVPPKSFPVLLLVFSILELGIASSSTFMGFQATFYYTWQYQSPAEDVPMARAAPPESPL